MGQGLGLGGGSWGHEPWIGWRWQLVKDYCDYKYSTAKYYELGIKEFDLFRI